MPRRLQAIVGPFEWENGMNDRNRLDPDDASYADTPKVPTGQDVRSLGPSDSSDTGADLIGPGLVDDDQLGLDRGTNEDSEGGHLREADAGAAIGDRSLASTTDSTGTGERATAGKEQDIRIGNDIAPDRIVGPEEAGLAGIDDD
jgi:hypothetical protein